jgi:TonB family protein
MRRRLLRCVALFILAAAATASAQRQVTVNWTGVAPDGEEFAVYMPEVNFRIRRELSFGEGVTLKPASFEIADRGTLFSVLSFAKSERATAKTLDAFVKGFRNALSKNSGGASAELQFDRELKLDGRAGRQFRLRVGEARGSARIYETAMHFYVVMAFGEQGSASAQERFQDSFTFDRASPGRIAAGEVMDVSTSPLKSPEPLWPVAGGMSAIGAVSTTPGGGVPIPDKDTGGRKMVISGGVLNGKAVAKPSPVYPPIAKAAHAQGTVTVQIVVDEEGYVIMAQAVSGHPLLQHAAVVAARQAHFSPTFLDGQPVKVSGVITYNFVLV